MIIQHLGLREVDYVEKHTGEKVRAELISPPGKEPLAEEAKPEEAKPEEAKPEEQNAEEATPA